MWKSMVLPAGGAALCWLLLMTLWLPLLNFMLGYKAWADKLRAEIELQAGPLKENICIFNHDLDVERATAFSYHAKIKIEHLSSSSSMASSTCTWLIASHDARKDLLHKVDTNTWQHIRIIRKPSDKKEAVVLYRRR